MKLRTENSHDTAVGTVRVVVAEGSGGVLGVVSDATAVNSVTAEEIFSLSFSRGGHNSFET
ncbi:hypothetical protein A2U01_0069370, partial [Trifolium medium]|nr:hypothetical protein [Trifolium medium]